MKPYKNLDFLRIIFLIIIIVPILLSCDQESDPKMEKILVVTGGHEFDPSFYKIF